MTLRVRAIGLGVALALLYVAGAELGFRMAFVAEQVSTVWPPTGIAIAALLLFGRRYWPAIWIGAFTANALTNAPLWTAVGIATGNTLEAVIAAWGLSRFTGFDPSFRRTGDAVRFVLFAALISTAIGASIGAVMLCLSTEPWSRFWPLWADWMLGDALGALVVAPVIMTITRPPHRMRVWRVRQAAYLLLLTIGVTELVFGGWLGPAARSHPLEFVIFPFVIAAAVRLGQPATALVVLAAASVTIANTVSGFGPFATDSVHESLILLQVFMGVHASSGLVLAATIAERRTASRRRAAAHGVGRVLASAETIEEAAPDILEAICENLEWRFGALWMVNARGDRLACLDTWGQDVRARAFAEVSRAIAFQKDQGLPGRVWATGESVWIEDVVGNVTWPREPAAREAGLHGAFGFPIRLGDGDVLGAVEIFHGRVAPPDADLLATMTTAGNQIGQFIVRKRAELAVRSADAERRDLLLRERTARQEAEDANRAKDQFLATLSHELRTPLNAIVGWTRMLLDGSIADGNSRHALEVIERNAQAQVQLVGDLLDVSRIITGGLALEVRPIDLRSVVGAALDAVRPAAEAKQIALRAALPPIAVITMGDPARLQQIVWNLLSNAVKFTPANGRVDIEIVDAGQSVGIHVRDTGPGIPSEFLPHVFERFRQGDGSPTRQHGGLGLGLAIVRHLTELHGGTVRAESEGAGRGATFSVQLPRAAHVSAMLPSADNVDDDRAVRVAPRVDGCRVLVVDDEPDARELAATVLEAAGATVRTAGSVSEALAAIEREWPDVVLADLAMPEQDGYVLIRELRELEIVKGRRLPAAAVSAYSREPDRRRALASGFDRHVAKPTEPVKLVETVVDLWKTSESVRGT